jgi:hypothetical protein
MLSAAKHLDAQRDRPSLRLRVTSKVHPTQRRALFALLSSRPCSMESWTCVFGWCLLTLNVSTPATQSRSRAMLSAQASMAFQSRKSPSGARTAFTIIRSAKDNLLWSMAPKKIR